MWGSHLGEKRKATLVEAIFWRRFGEQVISGSASEHLQFLLDFILAANSNKTDKHESVFLESIRAEAAKPETKTAGRRNKKMQGQDAEAMQLNLPLFYIILSATLRVHQPGWCRFQSIGRISSLVSGTVRLFFNTCSVASSRSLVASGSDIPDALADNVVIFSIKPDFSH